MKKSIFFGLMILVFIGSQSICAQEMVAKKYENPQWYNIVHIDYHSGTYSKALGIIDKYYRKASEKAGTNMPAMIIELNTGPYDSMAVWHMKDGIESMNWDISPDNIKWREALNEIAGGKDKADEIIKEYQSYVASSTNSIGRLRE
ncbi:MAG: hypothetical protein WBN11_05585 [Eudoraea sp.]|uniref:hypothetical protein n=1 Tax=Eudoraea sp. TaxID=1979955 RepID=UPI003C7544E5